MKICFYWFNLTTPPGLSVGVSILAHELSNAGHEVTVVLLNERVGMPFDRDRLAQHALENDFDLHALSFGQNHYSQAMELASIIKQVSPRAWILCGGVHTTLNAEAVIAYPDVDFVGLGEVDGLLVRFIDALQSGSGYHSVPSFWIKENDRVTRNPMAPLPDITNQTALFIEGIDYGPIIAASRGFAETVVGRGCPMKCNYCHNAAIQDTHRKLSAGDEHERRFCRLRSVDNVIEELKTFKRHYGDAIRAINFGDDVFASDPAWLIEFAARYAAEVGLPFIANAIAGRIDEDVAQLLAHAGCNMVKFGVESGSRRVRREVLNRALSEDRLAESVRLLRAHGINSRAYVMLGMPSETREEMQSTVTLCARLRFDSVRPSIMYPFPGTEIHRICTEQGLLKATSTIPTDYSSTTVLDLPPRDRDKIEKFAALYPWLLNVALEGEAASASQPLVDKVNALSHARWSDGEGRRIILDQSEAIHETLLASSVDHYHAPFPDRQDVIFLYRHRQRPLINVS